MFKVKKECCGQCLFGKDKIVSNARRRDILEGCARDDSHFICHKTDDACCRGFYDNNSTNFMRVSQRMGWIELVE